MVRNGLIALKKNTQSLYNTFRPIKMTTMIGFMLNLMKMELSNQIFTLITIIDGMENAGIFTTS